MNDLVNCLTKDKDGGSLWTEELTGDASYKAHYPDHKKYWQLIAAELQCFGAHSWVTIVRGGKGIPYREVLTDVCDKLKVKDIKKSDSILEIENKLLTKLLDDAMGKMSEAEREDFAKTIGIDNLKALTPNALTAAILLIFRTGGFKSFQLTVIIVNAVWRAIMGRGLAFAGNAALMKAASMLTGPIGWALTGLWTAVDIAGPAYRVTMPSVIQVALLRKRYQAEKDGIMEEIKREFGEL
jgi:uncharacterized protein YaaW (UPF0174 family)